MKTILFFIISSYSFSTSTASTSSSLTVDWNEQILTAFIDMIKEGYAKFIPNLIVILSLLTVLEIIWSIFRTVNRGIGREAIIVITKILIKFGLYFMKKIRIIGLKLNKDKQEKIKRKIQKLQNSKLIKKLSKTSIKKIPLKLEKKLEREILSNNIKPSKLAKIIFKNLPKK